MALPALQTQLLMMGLRLGPRFSVSDEGLRTEFNMLKRNLMNSKNVKQVPQRVFKLFPSILLMNI